MDAHSRFLSDLFQIDEEMAFIGWLFPRERFRFRSQYYSRRIAESLILEDGTFSKERLHRVIDELRRTPFLLQEGADNDTPIFEHLLLALSSLEPLLPLLNRCKLPLCHRRAEELIRHTLHYEPGVKLEHRDVKHAVLSSYLCTLRQTIGSCFATAPAIYVQRYQPLQFFKDIEELLSTGRLRRIFEGVEYAVPMSMSFGLFGLKKPSYSKKEILLPLARALESIHLIDGSLSLEGKIHKALELVTPLVKDELLSPEQLIRSILFRAYRISEADLRTEERMKKVRIQAIPTGGNIPLSFSEKSKEIRTFEEAFPAACASFSAFFENPLLRTWEYTLASYSDLKSDFTRWHLYNSLGMDPKEPNGLGGFLYNWVNAQFQKSKEEVDQANEEYTQAYTQARSTEAMIHRTEHEAQRGWLKIEFQGHMNEMHILEQRRDELVKKANEYSSFFSYLLEKYYEKFQEYFQEIYDPEMEIPSFIFQDSPAGFRLVYKHGRTDPNLWTWIYKSEQFLDTLREFFIAVEMMVYSECPLDEAKKDISDLTTEIVQWIQIPEFMEYSMRRASAVFKQRTEGIVNEETEVERSPWAYISGGTVETLIKVYYRREAEFAKVETQISEEAELIPFLGSIEEVRPMLACSPTHAFLYYPHWFRSSKGPKLLREEYEDRVASVLLDVPSQKFLMERFIQNLNSLQSHLFRRAFLIVDQTSLVDFSSRVLSTMEKNIPVKDLSWDPHSQLSALLYSNFPLTRMEEWNSTVQTLLGELKFSKELEAKVSSFLEKLELPDLIGSKNLFDFVKSAIEHCTGSSFVSEDYDQLLIAAMRRHHLCFEPIFFADPNWTNAYLGFVISPISLRWEVWHLDRLGRNGFPMKHNWVQGRWTLFVNPDEYS